MNMGMGLYLGHELRQEIKQEALIAHVLSLRIKLVQALSGEKFRPRGICPKCFKKLTTIEILKGFSDNPSDFTTRCPRCGKRFESILIQFSKVGQAEIPFYCSVQSLDQLRGKENLSPEKIAVRFAGLYRSIAFHHGTLHKAFEKIGISYPFSEIPKWEKKVLRFLGRMPDTVIAECAGVSVNKIRYLHAKHDIPHYTRDVAIGEIRK